jgi:hypothetical protein
VQSFLISSLVLVVIVAMGAAAITRIRTWWRSDADDRDDWENALADYKNLRDRGLLSDDEYRKIKTLVEPHVQSVPMAPSRTAASATDRAERNEPAQPSED